MFVRVKSSPNSPRKSVQIVHNQRHHGRVRQLIVRHLGIAANDDELELLKRLGKRQIAEMEILGDPSVFSPEERQRQLQAALAHAEQTQDDDHPLLVNLRDLREEARVVRGIHEVYGSMYDALGLPSVLSGRRYRTSARILKEIVMARLAQPLSKRASVRYLADNMGTQLHLDQVYRMMDHLTDTRLERLQRLATSQAHALLSPPVDVYFFDCTTLYFESFVVDPLKAPGFSKDAKFKESQVLLALMVTAEGLPVRYQVLPGHSFEGHSLQPVVAAFRRHVPLRQAVVVADRGMLSRANLQQLRDYGIDYVVGARLRSLPMALRRQLTATGQDRRSTAEYDYNEDRLIVRFSAAQAQRDASQRALQVQRLQGRVAGAPHPKALLSNRGYGKYLRIEGDSRVVLDDAKIAAEAGWDGLQGVITSLKELPAADAFSAYHGLWQVEQTFRISKHDLRVRPIFHWTPRRIQAHLGIAFMALMCVRHLEYRCRLQYRPLSPEAIQRSLLGMQQSVWRDITTDRRYAMPSTPTIHAAGLYKLFGKRTNEIPFELTD